MSNPHDASRARALSRTFGSAKVDPRERERRVREVFVRIAPRYDLMNDLMSMGLHRLWKRALARAVDPRPGHCIIDLAGGTGDVARRVAGSGRRVVVCDPSAPMMQVGRNRCPVHPIDWVEGTGEALPFDSECADTVTMAFGLRNVTDVTATLREVLRVLRPGGRFVCLEFSRPWTAVRPFYEAFSRAVIPRLGAWVARDPGAYRYLVESIREFPTQDELARTLNLAGFAGVQYTDLTFGTVCIHIGERPMTERLLGGRQ